jgi:processive 1,2-diacylglycerol beta-glucosyltransferase
VRVQIVSSRVGGGHQSVARALADALEDLEREDVRVWIDDLYADLARFPVSQFPRTYAVVSRRYPSVWRLFYHLTNRPPSIARLERLGDLLGGPALGRLLAEREPHAVISVLPGVNGFLARSLRGRNLSASLDVVITDWADIHLGWVAAGVDHYSAPTEEVAATCRALGVAGDAVTVTGLPVRRQFLRPPPNEECRRDVRERFGLGANTFVILAMMGGEGTAGAVAHLRALAATPLDAELVVACGRSERLRRRIAALKGPNRLRAIGFVEQIADLMLSADLLVTKPGGATLAEAFCCRLPIVVYDPLPGQEEGNVRFVVSRGAAELAGSPRHLASLVAELRWSPARLESLAARAAGLARPGAAAAVVDGVLDRARA